MPPEYPTETHEKKSKKKLILTLVLFTILIAGTTTLGLLYYKTKMDSQKQLANKQKTIEDLEGRNANYLKQIDALKKPEKEEVQPTATFREIPELGVKYALNDQTKDLTYFYTGRNSIAFSTIDLSNSAINIDEEGCLTNGPGGIIGKLNPTDQLNGTTAEAAANNSELKDRFKKIGEFYFNFSMPSGPCSQKTDLKSKIDQTLTAGKAAFDSLQATE